MTRKSYSAEDEEFVVFLRKDHTIKEIANMAELSESAVTRILSKQKSKPTEKVDEIGPLKDLLNQQQLLIQELQKAVKRLTPKVDDYEEEYKPTKLVLGRKS